MFKSYGDWHRDQLLCDLCHSNPRERALMHVLISRRPELHKLIVHESSPAERSITDQLRKLALEYIPSQYFQSAEQEIEGFKNINLEAQDFPSNAFDVFIALDVMEHVFNPQAAFQEIERTLKPLGIAVMTFPIGKSQINAMNVRATISNFEVTHHVPSEYHGNPIDPNGSLVTIDYGYDIHKLIAEWTHLDVEIVRFCNNSIGVVGEYTEVIVLTKTNLLLGQ